MNTASQSVMLEKRDGITLLFLKHGRNNAIDHALVSELATCMAELEEDDNCRGIVLASAHPKFFSPGFDLFATYHYDKKPMRDFMSAFMDLYQSMYRFPKPMAAAIHGHAIAGGLCLALTCDVRVLAESGALIGMNDYKVGIALPYGVLAMLKATVSTQAYRMIGLFGGNVSGKNALTAGLVDEIQPGDRVLDRAVEHAATLAQRPVAAFALQKSQLRRETLGRMEAQREQDLEEFLAVWWHPDVRQRMKEAVDNVS